MLFEEGSLWHLAKGGKSRKRKKSIWRYENENKKDWRYSGGGRACGGDEHGGLRRYGTNHGAAGTSQGRDGAKR